MIYQVVTAFMMVEGILFGIIAYVMFRRKSAKLAFCQKAWGEVIEVREHPRGGGDGGPIKHPVIRFVARNGETVTFESKFGRSNWEVKPGDRLEILVSPTDPADAEVMGFLPQWGIPIALGIISLGSIIGAPVLYLALKP